MGHTMADALIVAALAAALMGYLYLRHAARQRRMEIVHKERLVAMEKGIPLPELPLDPPRDQRPPDPRAPLLHGVVWTAFGFGGMAAMLVIGPLPNGMAVWPLALPLLFLGVGLILFYVLASNRAR